MSSLPRGQRDTRDRKSERLTFGHCSAGAGAEPAGRPVTDRGASAPLVEPGQPRTRTALPPLLADSLSSGPGA